MKKYELVCPKGLVFRHFHLESDEKEKTNNPVNTV